MNRASKPLLPANLKKNNLSHVLTEDKRANDSSKIPNIVIPGSGSWQLDIVGLTQFLEIIEQERRSGKLTHYSEKQDAASSSCVFDFDIDHYDTEPVIQPAIIHALSKKAIELFIKFLKPIPDVIFAAILKGEHRLKDNDETNTPYFREGFHIVMPGIKMSLTNKRYIYKKISEQDGEFHKILQDNGIDVVPNANIFDQRIAVNPVYFIGSVKSNTTKTSADKLVHLFKFSIKGGEIKRISDKLENYINENINWCAELSVNTAPAIPRFPRQHYEIADSYSDNVGSNAESEIKMDDLVIRNNLPPEKFREKYCIEQMILLENTDPDYKCIMKTLDLLDKKWLENKKQWMEILYHMSSLREEYRFIAEFFTRKSPHFKSITYFDEHWAQVRDKKRPAEYNPTIQKLLWILRAENEQNYHIAQNEFTINVIYRRACTPIISGNMTEEDFAKIMFQNMKHKYVTTFSPGDTCIVWYELVMPGDNMIDGEIYKFRLLLDKFSVSFKKYLTILFETVCKPVHNTLMVHANTAGTKEEAAYYKKIASAFAASSRSLLLKDCGKEAIIRSAEQYFMNINFGQFLDDQDDLLGVGNGILRLDRNGPELINRAHNYPVTKFTRVNYLPYDPTNPEIQKVEQIIRDIFLDNEESTFEFFMMYLANCIDFRPKTEIFLLCQGSGANAKTLLVEMFREALGSDFGCIHNSKLLTEDISRPETANTAAMKLKHSRLNIYDEFGVDACINDCSLKTIIGAVLTCAEKFKKQEVFRVKGGHIGLTNHRIRLKTNDYGTVRRILFCIFKREFREVNHPLNPYDEKNPNHRVLDTSIKNVYIKQPKVREAILSILVKWYYILQFNFGGDITKVPCPIIKKESMLYHMSQDKILDWLAKYLFISPKHFCYIQEIAANFMDFDASSKNRIPISRNEIVQMIIQRLASHFTIEVISGKQVINNVKIYSYTSELPTDLKSFGQMLEEKDKDFKFTSVNHQMHLDDWIKLKRGQ